MFKPILCLCVSGADFTSSRKSATSGLVKVKDGSAVAAFSQPVDLITTACDCGFASDSCSKALIKSDILTRI